MSFLQSEKIMSEIAFTALFLSAVLILVPFLHQPSYAKLALAALALGAATYVRPVAIYW